MVAYMDTLTALTTAPLTGSAGRHLKPLPAGTAVTFAADRIGADGFVNAHVVDRPRVRVWVHVAQLEAA